MQPHNPAQRHCKTSMLPSLAVLANGFTSIKCNILGRATQTRMSYLHGCPFPESRAPEDAARSPPRHSTRSSHDPHSQHKPHGHLNEKDYLAPRAPLSTSHSLSGRGRGERGWEAGDGERLTSGLTLRLCSQSHVYLEQGTGEMQRGPGVPSATDL